MSTVLVYDVAICDLPLSGPHGAMRLQAVPPGPEPHIASGGDATVRLFQASEGADETALERIAAWLASDPDVPIVMLCPAGQVDLAVRAMRQGAFDVLAAPLEPRTLGLSLEQAAQHATLRRDLRQTRATRTQGKRGLVGESPSMKQLSQLIDRMAPTPSSVLITGESGTGKELVARALHQGSPRSAGPFIAINCAAMPEALLESELFGHVRGAFTDAHAARAGLFAQAAGGTIFLDEIGDLPASLQPKLLRALQERVVRPVGGHQEIPLDVRILTATLHDLDALVEAGRFREDLLFRLDVLRLDLPPLRERGHDILVLAQRLLEQHAAAMGRTAPRLSPSVAACLLDYRWPGNVRELGNAMERVAALAGPDVQVSDLPPRLRRPRPPAPPAPSGILRPLADVEREHVLHVLSATGGQRARAASILGLDRKTLWRKLRAWGLADEASPS